jgi:arylsulfatase A-like enzyme
VALGDTDEHAHRGDYVGYLESLREADRFIGELVRTLAALDRYGQETTIVVTTDHGRAKSFHGHGGTDSARVWLMAAGGAILPRGAVAANRPVRLADVAPTFRALLGLEPERSPRAGSPIDALLALPAPVGSVLATRAQ